MKIEFVFVYLLFNQNFGKDCKFLNKMHISIKKVIIK